MAYKGHSGKFTPRNKGKYRGDADNIYYRSMWERAAMVWCDQNPDVVKWSSEEVVIPYICGTDGRWHRYFMDLNVEFKNGVKLLAEIKPKKMTQEPKKKKRITEAYKQEVFQWIKNNSKWEAASRYAERRGYKFQIWTEDTLAAMGINKYILYG